MSERIDKLSKLAEVVLVTPDSPQYIGHIQAQVAAGFKLIASELQDIWDRIELLEPKQ